MWLYMVFAGIRRLPCFAMCACGLVRFLLAYVGTRRHATLPTGMWLDLEHVQHRYLGNRPRRRSPITSVVSGTVSPLFLPVALRGQPSLTVGHGSHVHKCPCRWLGLRAPDESNRRHDRSCMWGRNGLRLTGCCGLTWFLLAFVGTHCHATCACSLARFLLAYAGSRCHAVLPTGTWLDLVPFQHRYLVLAN